MPSPDDREAFPPPRQSPKFDELLNSPAFVDRAKDLANQINSIRGIIVVRDGKYLALATPDMASFVIRNHEGRFVCSQIIELVAFLDVHYKPQTISKIPDSPETRHGSGPVS